jgi:biotin carboxylase
MSAGSVLLLGDDAHFVRACADLDVDVTVVCGLGQKDWGMVVIPSGKRQVFVEDALNIESVILGLYRADVDPSAFDAVYSTDEGGVVTAAALARTYGVPAMPPRVAALFRDKSLAKTAVRAAGIDTAEFIVIDDLFDLPKGFTMPYPCGVLKPVSGGATWHTWVVRSDSDLHAAVARARESGMFRTFILEQFVPGDEWHADGVVSGGELAFISVGGYRKTCLDTVSNNEWLHTFVFDPVEDRAVYERVTPLAERVLDTLGLRDGVFHLEVFHDAATGRLVFGECAARRGGGLIEEEISHKFGVSLARASVQCALGTRPAIEPDVRAGAVGCVYLPYTPGVLLARPSAEELTALPGVEFAMVERPIGFRMNPMESTIMKIGQVLLAGTRQELHQRADEVVTWYGDRTVVVPPQVSARELREWYASVAAEGAEPHSVWRQPDRPRSAGTVREPILATK